MTIIATGLSSSSLRRFCCDHCIVPNIQLDQWGCDSNEYGQERHPIERGLCNGRDDTKFSSCFRRSLINLDKKFVLIIDVNFLWLNKSYAFDFEWRLLVKLFPGWNDMKILLFPSSTSKQRHFSFFSFSSSCSQLTNSIFKCDECPRTFWSFAQCWRTFLEHQGLTYWGNKR